MRVMRFLRAGAHRYAREGCFLHLIGIEISRESAVEIIEIGPTIAE